MRSKDASGIYIQYEKIVHWFDAHRYKGLMERDYLELVIRTIPKKGTILDLGCGTGEPIAKFFIEKGYQVTGVDGSQGMIDLCKKRFPTQHWMLADMRNISLGQTFDAILAWHSFFHLNPDDQRRMFAVFESHIRPGGVLAFTSGHEEGEIWGDNGGQNLYHASLSSEEYQRLLTQHHFETLRHTVEDPACGDATVWIAQAMK
jgi:SAM-dependent methyltransferase